MFRRLLLSLLSLVALGAVAAAPAAQAQDTPVLNAAAEALATEDIYVHPRVESSISASELRRLKAQMDRLRIPMFVAIVPPDALQEGGGTDRGAIVQLAFKVDRRGTFALAVPGMGSAETKFIAGSNLGAGDNRVADAASDAADAHRGEGVGPVVLDFVERVDALSVAGASSSAGGTAAGDTGDEEGFGIGALLLLVIGGLVAGVVFFMRRERSRGRSSAFAEARDDASDDLADLDEEIRSLGVDTGTPGSPKPVLDDYSIAVSAYERAERAWKSAEAPRDLEAVSMALEEGRWAAASARARLEGREPPLRRPPCFFDPRHGPSTREVEWSPPYGAARAVPACEQDALRVERGEDPAAREVVVGGQKTPYWNAGSAYAPFASGFFGGARASLLPSLLVGSMLGMSVGARDAGDAGDSGVGAGDPGGAGAGFGGGSFDGGAGGS